MSFVEQIKKNIKNKKGFSLLELVLAVAIFSFSSFALATMIIDSNISTRLSADRTEALLYAKEGVEAVRSIRDNNWATWVGTADGNHGLMINSANSTWAFNTSDSDLINDKYTRTVNLATDPLVPTSRDVSVNISWNLTPGRIASTTLSTIFSNWPDVINSSLVVPRGLVSYWSFDDAGYGTALDSVGGNDGTVTGATATTSVKGIPDQAYSFNGSSDYINIPDTNMPMGNSDRSISLWFKTAGGGYSDQRLFAYGIPAEALEVHLYITSSELVLENYNNDLHITGSWQDNVWHNVIFTYVGATHTRSIYIDNSLMVTDSSFILNTTSYGNLVLGAYYNALGSFFIGSMDNVRIYRRALTQDDIATIYNAEKP